MWLESVPQVSSPMVVREVAALIGAAPAEIIFTSGATEANNLALLGVGRLQQGCIPARHRVLYVSGGTQSGLGAGTNARKARIFGQRRPGR